MLSTSAQLASATSTARSVIPQMKVLNPPKEVLAAQERLFKRPAKWKPQEVAPDYLTGALAGDNGFDPMCMVALAKSPLDGPWSVEERVAKMEQMSEEDALSAVLWMREAEVKHARMAMLAVVGWPMAELINPWSLEETAGRAPSLFNGGLDQGLVLPFVLAVAAFAATKEMEKVDDVTQTWISGEQPEGYVAGDFGFDPLGLSAEEGAYQQQLLRSSELFNGRLAMLAITGFAVQEFLYQKPVVQQTPFFFGR